MNTYQRMVNKSRLRAIRSFINDGGIFPTNIVINLERKPQFQRTEQEGTLEKSTMGWLDLKPSFKSAWIIDGQHRLFAYSGLERAASASLSVLAFEELPASKQAELFIDINAEQRKVKQSLLQELYAELHWNAAEPEIRVRAIVSKAVQSLDDDRTSPFYQRIVMSDEIKSDTHCISIRGLTSAIQKQDFYIGAVKGKNIVSYGPLWGGSNDETLKRSIYILNGWFRTLIAPVQMWWQIGSGEGGGLAMNDAVTACIAVLDSVFDYLQSTGHRLVELDNEEIVTLITPFATSIGKYLSSLDEEERKRFRDMRGGQGQTIRTRRMEAAIHADYTHFNPPELGDFLRREKAQTNSKAKETVDRIEVALQKTVVDGLKQEYGPDESQWWMLGVPRGVRQKVTKAYEDDDGKRGGKEYYFDLLDYRNIAHQNWEVFEGVLGQGKQGQSKDKRTAWMNDVNEIRRVVAHASSGVSVSVEQLEQLQQNAEWFHSKLTQTDSDS